jgi:iron-sulfur cluster repair protein YtfE (RIC family)
MDILDHLMEEHRKVERLLEQLSSSEEGSRRASLIDELNESLEVHMAVEEAFLYPIVEQVVGSEASDEAEAEHGLTREGLATLQEYASESGFGAAVDMIKGGIQHHVKEEETEIFPKLRKQASEQLRQLDPDELEQEVKASASSRSKRAKGTIDLTKEELYKRAQEAGVPGRSSMTKQQLAKAVAKKS